MKEFGNIMGALTALAALLLSVAGINYLTQATLGVGLIALAAVAGIFTRIFQADANGRQQSAQLFQLNKELVDLRHEVWKVKKIQSTAHNVTISNDT